MPTSINASGITFPNGTTQTTAASGAGTVTSVATGNGLQGGTITTSGTLSVACPGFNTVGSYCFVAYLRGGTFYGGVSLAAGTGANQLQICGVDNRDGTAARLFFAGGQISGTWRTMGAFFADDPGQYCGSLACRIS